MEMGHKLAHRDYFEKRWEDLDTNKWPGRELLWLWCHPFTAGMILASFVGTCLLYWTGY